MDLQILASLQIYRNQVELCTWRIPWAEKPGEVQSTGLQSQTRLKQLSIHAYTTYSLSIHLSVDCFHLLASVNNASVNNAAINLGEPISFGDLDFNSMEIQGIRSIDRGS